MKDQLLNRFVGTLDDRDEYQKQEIFKELAFSGMILYYVMMILMVVSLIVDTVKNEFSFMTPTLVVINIAYSFFIVARLNKKQLDTSDCATPEEYEFKKNKLKKSCRVAGIQWGLSMLLFMEYLMPLISGEKIVFSWIQIIIWCLGGVLFGVCMYAFAKSKLQRHYEMEEAE